ncbi:MAG TPA: dTMP kinase [Fimbriimonadaceae bacterium]|nr:dTMP kinase [Fimbriimonadaceae bacterium]
MFVTFEGPEGAGKTTAIKGIAERLTALGHQVLTTREPGSGTIGQQIRNILLHGEAMHPRCELFLFLADRANHVETIIRPALAEGKVVLCDRYADSTVVYQGYGRGLDLAQLRELNTFATGGLQPDVTFLFDLDPEVGLARQSEKDRLDEESMAFHERVRAGFLEEAKRDSLRYKVLDATHTPKELQEQCLTEMISLLSSRSADGRS